MKMVEYGLRKLDIARFYIRFFLQQLNLTPGTQMRDMFTVVPFPLDFKIYMWNITNKEEVFVGGKPKLQEVGPYYFELSLVCL